MATENKGVMVYLPKDVEEYITSFCTEYKITRKDKEGNILPSLGTGVVTYLKSKISGESPDDILTKPSKALGNGLTKDEVLDLIREYNTSELPSNGLSKDEVLDLMKSELLGDSLLEELRAELSEVSEFARNLQGEIAKVKQALSNRVESSNVIEAIPPKSARKTSEALDLETDTDATWATFHKAVGLETPSKKSLELSNTAISKAIELGFTGWTYNSKKQTFHRNSP
jgi:hypothetical protein